MGCGGSKEVPNLTNNNNGEDVKLAVGQEEADRAKNVETNSESDSSGSPSPIELTPDKNEATKLAFHGERIVSPEVLHKKGLADTLDGWRGGQSKESPLTNGSVGRAHNEDAKRIDSVQDSEYGKDGIDLTSTSYGAMTIPKLSSELFDSGIRFEVTQRLTKKDSEEPFDPSALVNMDKFKAVNAPKEVRTTGSEDKAVSMDTKQDSQEKSTLYGQVVQSSPTNYHAFYDEDEKALMDSIEKDFVETVHTTLPGAVM